MGWGDSVDGRAKMKIARSIAFVVLMALSLMLRYMPMPSSTYISYQPCIIICRCTSYGSDAPKGVGVGGITGDGISRGDGYVALVLVCIQFVLIHTSFAMSIITSIRTHYLAGLNDPPNISLR